MLLLNEADAARVPVNIESAVEHAFRAIAERRCRFAFRTRMEMPGGIESIYKPGFDETLGLMGAKLVTFHPANEEKLRAVYLLFDLKTGGRLAMIEATRFTALRTAAISALATRYLSREDAHVLAIFGTGAQARAHLDAMMNVRNLRRILVVGTSSAKAGAFVGEALRKYGGGPTIEPADEMRAVGLADIICTCTTSTKPVIHGKFLKNGCHINAVGAGTLDAREVDTQAVLRAKVVVEDKEYGVAQMGDLRIPVEEGKVSATAFGTDLGDLVTGKASVRRTPNDITLFKSIGHPAEDLYLAAALYKEAKARGIGTEAPL